MKGISLEVFLNPGPGLSALLRLPSAVSSTPSDSTVRTTHADEGGRQREDSYWAVLSFGC